MTPIYRGQPVEVESFEPNSPASEPGQLWRRHHHGSFSTCCVFLSACFVIATTVYSHCSTHTEPRELLYSQAAATTLLLLQVLARVDGIWSDLLALTIPRYATVHTCIHMYIHYRTLLGAGPSDPPQERDDTATQAQAQAQVRYMAFSK